MYRSNERDLVYKFGEYGPGYLARGPLVDMGVIVLRPGDDYPNHYHAHAENLFFTLEGEASLWSDCRERFTLRRGDLHRCDPWRDALPGQRGRRDLAGGVRARAPRPRRHHQGGLAPGPAKAAGTRRMRRAGR